MKLHQVFLSCLRSCWSFGWSVLINLFPEDFDSGPTTVIFGIKSKRIKARDSVDLEDK